MVRLCGAALGLFAFAITILQGLLVNNPVETTLVRAVKAMFGFCVLGLCLGWVSHRVLDEHALRRSNELFKVIDEEEGAAGDAKADGSTGGGSAAGDQAGSTAPQPAAGT